MGVRSELEELRKLDTPISQETTDWLLEISDMFAAWHDDLKQDRELTHVKFSLLKLPDLDK